MLAMAQARPLDELQRARVDLLRAEIAFASRRGSDAPPLLLKAARQLEPLDLGLARETYLEAFTAAVLAGRLSRGADVAEVSRAARLAPAPSASAPRARFPPRRPGAAGHRRPRRWHTAAETVAERFPRPGHLHRGRAALAVARWTGGR